jgi:hypothetical protein
MITSSKCFPEQARLWGFSLLLMLLHVVITSRPIINIIFMVVMVLHMVAVNKKEVVVDVVMSAHPHRAMMLHAKYVRSMGNRPSVIGDIQITMMMILILSDSIAHFFLFLMVWIPIGIPTQAQQISLPEN